MKISDERRRNRSDNAYTALRYQLDACRRRAGLEGMVLTDETGLALALAGEVGSCDEVAARLSLVGRKVPAFAGVLFSDEGSWEVTMRRFSIGESELYMCAIGGSANPRAVEVERSIGGATRILA
jgi:hypothetical protein